MSDANWYCSECGSSTYPLHYASCVDATPQPRVAAPAPPPDGPLDELIALLREAAEEAGERIPMPKEQTFQWAAADAIIAQRVRIVELEQIVETLHEACRHYESRLMDNP